MKSILSFLLTILIMATIITPVMAQQSQKTMTVLCPKASALKKNPVKLTWSANHGSFRSYDTSFAKRIDKFTGAQWVGATVGQVTCVYNTFPKTAFPVLLIYHTLTLSPKGGSWTKNLGGYKNCDSLNPSDCAFKVRLKKKITNIYKEAESLKSSAPDVGPPTE